MNRNALPIAGGVIAAALAGFLLGSANTATAETPAPATPVNVSIVHEESGEARSIDLTDSNGDPVEVGSVAEEFPWMERDHADEVDDGDQSTESDG